MVVPHETAQTEFTVWIGTRVPPTSGLTLQVGSRAAMDVPGNWAIFEVEGQPKYWSQRITVDSLQSGHRYPLRLLVSGDAVATGMASTLPEQLPRLGATPFTCLIGSCFAHYNDAAGAAGAAYRSLPAAARPDVKFLCGDQVYLDAPFPRYLLKVIAEQHLGPELLAAYLATWAQGGDGRGYHEILRTGANYFASDDHEIWNNAPLPTATVRATWWPFGDKGAAWLRFATALYDQFQTTSRTAQFEVGTLSFFVLDTRLNRVGDRSSFCLPADLARLGRWVDALNGPGVLVMGQPIFVEPSGITGYVTDFGLADFNQYGELVRVLQRSSHDLMVLTGDVHYGRVAGCRLPSGASLVEVIASPFSLVDARVGGKWHKPPLVFPAVPVPGTTQGATWFQALHDLATNQFATLEFTADGGRVLASVRAWPIPDPGSMPISKLVFQQRLN